jgi:peptide/nickel transport system substrate-binding protein
MRQTWMTKGSSNYQGYRNAAFDAAVDGALTSFDAAQSRAFFTKAFQLAIDDAPSIWLYEQRSPVAVNRRIRTAPLRADGWYANLADWSVDPAQRIARDKIGLGGGR